MPINTTIELNQKRITFPFTYFCSCCGNPHMAIQFSEFQIETLSYFLGLVRMYLQDVISDTENETEDYHLQCTEELAELERLVKWIRPMGTAEATEEIGE